MSDKLLVMPYDPKLSPTFHENFHSPADEKPRIGMSSCAS